MLNFRFQSRGRTLRFSQVLLELIIASDKWDWPSLSQHLTMQFKVMLNQDGGIWGNRLPLSCYTKIQKWNCVLCC